MKPLRITLWDGQAYKVVDQKENGGKICDGCFFEDKDHICMNHHICLCMGGEIMAKAEKEDIETLLNLISK